MRSTIEWSHRLLGDEEQRLYQWLAVFSDGFELDAAQHLGASIGIGKAAAAEHVASLVHKSMVGVEPTRWGIRYRMLETLRDFALEKLDSRGEREAAAQAQAAWVVSLTDQPVRVPCSAAVERNALRLERETANWRDAVTFAERTRSGDLAGRLCGPPVAFFLIGRHDLADLLRPLLDLPTDLRHRRSVLVALVAATSGSPASVDVESWVAEIEALEVLEPTGVGRLMTWMMLACRGDFATAVEVCAAAARDPRFERSTRDLFVGIATLDHFGLTDSTTDTYGLMPEALDVIDRTDVALQRVTCLLGLAWGTAEQDPLGALALVERALDHIDAVPALTRLTLPGSASRLLARLDPTLAARGLLTLLDGDRGRRTFVDLIPLVYATGLLERVGHPASATALSGLAVDSIGADLSMMDAVALASRASAVLSLALLEDVEQVVRSALFDIVAFERRDTADVCG